MHQLFKEIYKLTRMLRR